MEYARLSISSSPTDMPGSPGDSKTTLRISQAALAPPPSKIGPRLEMLLLLAGGLLFATAHFLYYHFTDGRATMDTPLSQEWTIRIGTALAFLTKTCWTVAALVAHAQQVWRTVEEPGKRFDAATVDALFAVVADFTKFHRWRMMRHARTATAIAIVVWCLPLSAVFAPATLTVVPANAPQTISAEVPVIDFANATKFAQLATCSASSCGVQPIGDGGTAVQFRFPSAQTVVQTAATSSGGRIQQMVPVYPNSTYQISFFGPAILCTEAIPATVIDIDHIDNLTATVPDQVSVRETMYCLPALTAPFKMVTYLVLDSTYSRASFPTANMMFRRRMDRIRWRKSQMISAFFIAFNTIADYRCLQDQHARLQLLRLRAGERARQVSRRD